MKTYKVLSVLLSYPKEEWISALDEFMPCIKQDGLLPKKVMESLSLTIAQLKKTELIELQEEYVRTFDQGRGHCLNLFEHVYGESRDRGQAMVDLLALYKEQGLIASSGELPDYLPLFLEYLSLLPAAESAEKVGDAVNVIAAIQGRLNERESKYAAVFSSLISLTKQKPDFSQVKAAIESTRGENKPENIDKQWEEAAAFSGNKTSEMDGCPTIQNQQKVSLDQLKSSSHAGGQH